MRPSASSNPSQPLLIPASEAAHLCGRSVASWWRDLRAGRVPEPIRLGGKTLWRRADICQWVEAGCPPQALCGPHPGQIPPSPTAMAVQDCTDAVPSPGQHPPLYPEDAR